MNACTHERTRRTPARASTREPSSDARRRRASPRPRAAARVDRRFARVDRTRDAVDVPSVAVAKRRHRAVLVVLPRDVARRRDALARRADAPRACGACAGRTRACARFATCRAMARGGDGWDDRRVPGVRGRADEARVGRRRRRGRAGARDVAARAVLVVRRRDATSSDARGGETRDAPESLRGVREGDAPVRAMRGWIREDRGRAVREVRGMGGGVDDERGVRGGDETRRVVLVVRGKELARQARDARERRVRVHGVRGGGRRRASGAARTRR